MNKKERRKFSITEEQRHRVVMSTDPVLLETVLLRIRKQQERDERHITKSEVFNWLDAQGLVDLKRKHNESWYEPTEEGEYLGITSSRYIENKYDGFHVFVSPRCLFNINAQAYIIANLELIAEFSDENSNIWKRENGVLDREPGRKNAYNDQQLICRLQNTLNDLLHTLPKASKWDDVYDYDVVEMLETACSLRDEIDQLGYDGSDEELDVLDAYVNIHCEIDGPRNVAQELADLGASNDLLASMGFDWTCVEREEEQSENGSEPIM